MSVTGDDGKAMRNLTNLMTLLRPLIFHTTLDPKATYCGLVRERTRPLSPSFLQPTHSSANPVIKKAAKHTAACAVVSRHGASIVGHNVASPASEIIHIRYWPSFSTNAQHFPFMTGRSLVPGKWSPSISMGLLLMLRSATAMRLVCMYYWESGLHARWGGTARRKSCALRSWR